jgi:peroxiredoxin
LQAYQTILPDLRTLDTTLVAVSPQLPDKSLTTAEKNALEFEVLSDSHNVVAGEYGLVWTFPEELRDLYRQVFGIVLADYNGDDSWQLPVPATFVIAADGVIRFAFADVDYTRRAEPASILEALGRSPA